MPIYNVRPFKVLVDGETWTEIISSTNMASEGKVYTIDATGRIVFGDGINGRPPETGSQVVASYRQGGGADGNLEISIATRWPPKNSKFLVVIEDQSLKISPAGEVESGSGSKRPSFYAGQLLTSDDLIAEQQYHIEKRRRHNQYLHCWGVVMGLEVNVEHCADSETITVSPGYALDNEGREIILTTSIELQIGMRQSPQFVTVEYSERGTDWILSTDGEQKLPSRIEECALVTLLDKVKEQGALTIARLINTPTGWAVDCGFQPIKSCSCCCHEKRGGKS